jgi:putative membrane protein
MMGGWFGFPMVGGIMMLLFWGLIIVGAIWLVQSLARGGGPIGTGAPPRESLESPLDILKRRYAKGELTKEQFEEMKRDLGQ